MRVTLLRVLYPLLMKMGKWFRKEKNILRPLFPETPILPFSSLSVRLNNGQDLSFAHLAGKKVLLVNTASYCGYTSQLKELEVLYQQHKGHLEIIAFPANDFGAQEPGEDAQIAQFCRMNYNTTFPIARKSVVRKTGTQHPVYRWLTDSSLNGWNDQEPVWNFCKYLVNENGVLEAYYAQTIAPEEIKLT